MKTSHTPTRSIIQRFVSALPALSIAVAGFFPGEVRAQITTWGNTYNGGTSSTSAVVTNVNSQWTTFTADDDRNVSSIWINSTIALAASTSLNVELYLVDTITGKPTGTALATQTISSAPVGWNQVTGFNYTLSKGTAYALRLSAASGDPGFGWRIINSNTTGGFNNANTVQPISGDTDPYWGRGRNADSPAYVGQAVWLLEAANGSGFGQPYNTSANANLASATAAVGQRFQFQAPNPEDVFLQGVTLDLNIAATPPANPLTVHLLDSDGSILATGTLDLSTAAAGRSLYTVNLSTPFEMTDESIYYLALYSDESTDGSVLWNGAATDQNDSTFIGSTFQGDTGYVVTWASQSDFSGGTSNLLRDYYFGLNLSSVPEPTTAGLIALAGGALLLSVRRRTIRA